jgi:hypothetical protein
MKNIHQQSDANKFFEGGLFYPTGYIVAAIEPPGDARTLKQTLLQAGFKDEEILISPAQEMAEEAKKNLDDNTGATVGATVPVREKQLHLAQEGCDFLIIHAPADDDEKRALAALSGRYLRYAVKYRLLVIENLMPQIPQHSTQSEPAREP